MPATGSQAAPAHEAHVAFSAHPLAALREGRLLRRFVQLYAGLVLYGLSLAVFVEADVGLAPWDVLHQGLTRHTPLTMGTAVIVVSFAVLLAWIPLRQWPGIGTVSNAIVVGLAVDLGLWLLPTPEPLWLRSSLMVAAVVLNAIATAAYIGARFGPGPRDGLMTGLVRTTGRSIRLVRTVLEVAVVAIGWLLGGTFGVGTLAYALGIGPLTQFFLPRLAVRRTEPTLVSRAPARQD